MRAWLISIAAGSLVLLALFAEPDAAPQPRPAATPDTDWPMYRRDPAGTGWSPLTQINAGNAARLRSVWTYGLQSDAPVTGRGAGGPNSEATPIVVNGTMYVPAANRVVALDPQTGQERWRFVVPGGAPSRRGVAYWPGDGTLPARIFVAAGRRLIALNAATGALEARFGTNGEIDMVVPYNSVPLVHRNIVVVGANTPPGAIGGVGNPRAFDARTGAKIWEFNSVAQPGEVGHDTWEGDSWKNRLGANAWPFYFTLDEQRGLLYVPLASPIVGAYGGDRKGANLFGNSVVAVDIDTGKYRWHFQTIHHDLWDADPPAPPGLFDITQNGRTIPALGVTTKSGYLYILNRETGAPIFGVEERPVPKSDVPGELAFPTQPFPVKPPPLARVRIRRAISSPLRRPRRNMFAPVRN
jgi:quinoprotein glucose dehydrogenase